MNDSRIHGENAASLRKSQEFMVPSPFDRPLELFLAGEMERSLDIDRLFGRQADELIGKNESVVLKRCCLADSVLATGYKIGIVDIDRGGGVILLSPAGEIVGAYRGCLLSVAPGHQGRGLGAELVFDLAYATGALPTWFLDTPSYSPAGLAAHRRAWFLARDPVFTETKVSLLAQSWRG